VSEQTAIKDQWHQYMAAVYGQDYVYRAPESFLPLEQWMLTVLSGHNDEYAQKLMDKIVAQLGGVS